MFKNLQLFMYLCKLYQLHKQLTFDNVTEVATLPGVNLIEFTRYRQNGTLQNTPERHLEFQSVISCSTNTRVYTVSVQIYIKYVISSIHYTRLTEKSRKCWPNDCQSVFVLLYLRLKVKVKGNVMKCEIKKGKNKFPYLHNIYYSQ